MQTNGNTKTSTLTKTSPEKVPVPAPPRDDWFADDWSRSLTPSLAPASPWQMMRQMEEAFNRFFGPSAGAVAPLADTMVAIPRLDVSETDGEWLIEAEMPGVKQEDIQVEVKDGVLRLSARSEQATEEGPDTSGNRQYYRRERRSGWMERALTLPDGVEEEKITCEYKNGVLCCHVPKQPGAGKSRRIPISAQ